MALDPFKTAVIFIGAESFPKSKNFAPDTAFREAKNRIEKYFSSTLKVERQNILDLFDSEGGFDAQDSAIIDFLKAKIPAGIEDLFIYYVGHGGYSREDFYLSLKTTRHESPLFSSMPIKALGQTISKQARSIRTFLILDCCFAGAGGMGFMSESDEGLSREFKDAFPSRGVTLLCASSKDLRARIIGTRNITMFTEGLDHALSVGDRSYKKKYVPLRKILEFTHAFIKDHNPVEAVKPEIISPDQSEGDIADISHFRNFSYEDSKSDILEKRREIETEMMRNNFDSLAKKFLDFVWNFDLTEQFVMEAILLSSESTELATSRERIKQEEYTKRKTELYKAMLVLIREIFNQNTNQN
ncbi:hypothetical protein [Pedobacter ghigonis]|uniref:hypothetical protein n=1 Tax=Pedobacter ghigonis TaxID=2730403 RepID=UPI00158BFE92|nr:hypothetical protein [Pedobacter ghigonis]